MRVELGDEAKKWCVLLLQSHQLDLSPCSVMSCSCARSQSLNSVHLKSQRSRLRSCAACRSEHCLKTFYESYDFANRTLSMLLGCTAETIEWGPPLGPPLDEWYKCAGRRGQPFCPGIPSTQVQPVRSGDTSQGSEGKRPLLQ